MIKRKFAKFIDFVFIIAGTFIVSFFLLRYYINALWLLIILSLFASVSVLGVCRVIFGTKYKQKKEKEKYNRFFEQLLFSGEEYVLSKLKEAILRNHEAIIENGLIISGKSAFCACFDESLTISKMARFYAEGLKSKCKKLIILCAESHPKAKSYAKQLNDIKTTILEGKDSYEFLKWIGFETPSLNIGEKRNRFSKTFSGILSPDKALRYFSLFILFLGFSFITNYSVYYISFSAIMLTMSIISKSDIINKLKRK